jgi:hypothetical protein
VAEAVHHPAHYGGDVPHEVYKCLATWGLLENAYLWNAVKYISRAGKKDPKTLLQDLEKASWYLQREIERLSTKPESLPGPPWAKCPKCGHADALHFGPGSTYGPVPCRANAQGKESGHGDIQCGCTVVPMMDPRPASPPVFPKPHPPERW